MAFSRYDAREGQTVRLYMRFFANGVLVDPDSLGKVYITPSNEVGTIIGYFSAPIKYDTGVYYIDWRVPSTDINSPYYNALFAEYVNIRGKRTFSDVWTNITINGSTFTQTGDFYISVVQSSEFSTDNLLSFDFELLNTEIPKGSIDYIVMRASEKSNKLVNGSSEFPEGEIVVQRDESFIRSWSPASHNQNSSDYAYLLDTSNLDIGRYATKVRLNVPEKTIDSAAELIGTRSLVGGYSPNSDQIQNLDITVDGVKRSVIFDSNATRGSIQGASQTWANYARLESTSAVASSSTLLNGITATFKINGRTLPVTFGSTRSVIASSLSGGKVLLQFSASRPEALQPGDTIYRIDNPAVFSTVFSLSANTNEVILDTVTLGNWTAPFDVGLNIALTPDDIVSQINTQAIANLGYSVAETFNDGGVKLRLFSKDRGSFTYNETIPSTSSTGIGYVEIVSVSHASKTADFQNTTKWTVGDIAYCNDYVATVSPSNINNLLKIGVDPTNIGFTYQNISFPTGYWDRGDIVDFINGSAPYNQAQIVSERATDIFATSGKIFAITSNAIAGGTVSESVTFTGTDPIGIADIVTQMDTAFTLLNVTVDTVLVGGANRLRITSNEIGASSILVIASDSGTGGNLELGFTEGDESTGGDRLYGAIAELITNNRLKITGDIAGSDSKLYLDSESNGSVANSILRLSSGSVTVSGTDSAGAQVTGNNGNPIVAISPSTSASVNSAIIPTAGIDLNDTYLNLQIDDAKFLVEFENTKTAASILGDSTIYSTTFPTSFKHYYETSGITHKPIQRYLATTAGGGLIDADGSSDDGYFGVNPGNSETDFRGFMHVPGSPIYGHWSYITKYPTPASSISYLGWPLAPTLALSIKNDVESISYITKNYVDASNHVDVGGVIHGIMKVTGVPNTTSYISAFEPISSLATTLRSTSGFELNASFGNYSMFDIAVKLDLQLTPIAYGNPVVRSSSTIGAFRYKTADDWYLLDLSNVNDTIEIGNIITINGVGPAMITDVYSRVDDILIASSVEHTNNKLSIRANSVPVLPLTRLAEFDTTSSQSIGDIVSELNTELWSYGDSIRADQSGNKLLLESNIFGNDSHVELNSDIFDGGALPLLGIQQDSTVFTYDTAAVTTYQVLYVEFDDTDLFYYIDDIVGAETVALAITDSALGAGNLIGGFVYASNTYDVFGNAIGVNKGRAYLLVEVTVPFTTGATISGMSAGTAPVTTKAVTQTTSAASYGQYVFEMFGVIPELNNGYGGYITSSNATTFSALSKSGARPFIGAGQETIYFVFDDFSGGEPAGFYIVTDIDRTGKESIGTDTPLVSGEITTQINAAASMAGLTYSPASVTAANRITLDSQLYGEDSIVALWQKIPALTVGALNAQAALGFWNDMTDIFCPVSRLNDPSPAGIAAIPTSVTITNDNTATAAAPSNATIDSISPLYDPVTLTDMLVLDVSSVNPALPITWTGIEAFPVASATPSGSDLDITITGVIPTWLDIGSYAIISDTVLGRVINAATIKIEGEAANAALWNGSTVRFSNGWPTEGDLTIATSTNYLQGGYWGYGSWGTTGNDLWKIDVNGTEYSTRISSITSYSQLASFLTSDLSPVTVSESSGDLSFLTNASGASIEMRVKGGLENSSGSEEFGFGNNAVLKLADSNGTLFTTFIGYQLYCTTDPTWSAILLEIVDFKTLIIGGATHSLGSGLTIGVIGDTTGLTSILATNPMTDNNFWHYAELQSLEPIDISTDFDINNDTLSLKGSDGNTANIRMGDNTYTRSGLLNFLNMDRIGTTLYDPALISGNMLIHDYGLVSGGGRIIDRLEGTNTVRLKTAKSNVITTSGNLGTTLGRKVSYGVGPSYGWIVGYYLSGGVRHYGILADLAYNAPLNGDSITNITDSLSTTVSSILADKSKFQYGKPVEIYELLGIDYVSVASAGNTTFIQTPEFYCDATFNLNMRDKWVAGSFEADTVPHEYFGSLTVLDSSVTTAWGPLKLDSVMGNDGLYYRVGGSDIENLTQYPYSRGTAALPPVLIGLEPIDPSSWITGYVNSVGKFRFDDEATLVTSELNAGSPPKQMTLWSIVDGLNGYGTALGVNATYPLTCLSGYNVLIFDVDSVATNVNVVFTVGTTYTLDSIVDIINTAITGTGATALAVNFDGQLLIKSTTSGATSKIVIYDYTNGSTINGWLGYSWLGQQSIAYAGKQLDISGTERGLALINQHIADSGQITIASLNLASSSQISAVEVESIFNGSNINKLLGFNQLGFGPGYGFVSDTTYSIDNIVSLVNAQYGGLDVASNSGNALKLTSLVQGSTANITIFASSSVEVKRLFGLTPQTVIGTSQSFVNQTIVSPWVYFDVV